MNAAELTENWALWFALVPGLIVVAALAYAWYRRSAAGKLRRLLAEHRKALHLLDEAQRSIRKADSRVSKFTAKAQSVKPRLLAEARAALEDARALAEIADDKVQVTANHLRRTIYEEFPPSAHERLRRRYLPQDVRDNRPFTF